MDDDLANSADLMCWILLKHNIRRYSRSEMKDMRISCYIYLLSCTKVQQWDINVLQMMNNNRYRPKIDKKKVHIFAEDTINHILDHNLS